MGLKIKSQIYMAKLYQKVLPQNKSEMILAILLFLFMMGLFPRISYLLDLINHFRPYFLIIFFGIIVYKFFQKYENRIWVYIALALFLNISTTPSLPRIVSNSASNSEIKIIHVNLLVGNNNYQETINLIKANHPHVISFQEATFSWVQVLKEKLQEYKFICKTINSPFDICVATLIPVVEQSVFYLPNSNVPAIYIKSKVNNIYLSFVFVHPKPPFNQSFFEQRNSYFNQLIDKIKDYENLLLVGDLNITQWSPIYHNLERKLNLKNTLSGFDNTWPTFFPFPIFQLDHILISQNLKLINSQVLENVGSDHLPIMSEINLPNFNRS